MSAATLLEDLDAPAGEVWASEAGDNLRYKGPKKALMPEVLAELKARKAEILDHIRPPGDLRRMPRRWTASTSTARNATATGARRTSSS